MSITPSSTKSNSVSFRVFVVSVNLLSVVVLQAALLWWSYQSHNQQLFWPERSNDSWNEYWLKLLQFDNSGFTDFLSGTLRQDDLIILVQQRRSRSSSYFPFFWNDNSHEIIQWNLRSGRTKTSYAPTFTSTVISHGKTLSWPESRTNTRAIGRPFYWNGRSVQIVASDPGDLNVELYQLSEFVRGNWKNTENFVLLPRGIGFDHNVVCRQDGEIYLLAYKVDDFETYYRKGLPTGSKQQAVEFAKAYPRRLPELTADQLDEIGWKRIRFALPGTSDQHGPFQHEPFGIWFENSHPCAIGIEHDEQDVLGFRMCRYQGENFTESKWIRSPIRWGQSFQDVAEGGGWFQVITSESGEMFVVSNHVDGRMHVLKWDDGQFSLIAQRSSPQIYGEVFTFITFIGVVVIQPMIVLGLAVWILQRWQGGMEFSFAHETRTLASGIRRGTARFIDMFIPLSCIAISIVFHPDAIGWWLQMKSNLQSVLYTLDSLIFDPGWYSFDELQPFSDLFLTSIAPPFIWSLFVSAIVFHALQIIWQARTGQTLGKWLMSVRVLRATLRPCGLARSLLREILFVLDSLFLFSCVPGVISILATRNSQRIGDLLADTIVVRDPFHPPTIGKQPVTH